MLSVHSDVIFSSESAQSLRVIRTRGRKARARPKVGQRSQEEARNDTSSRR